MSPSPGGQLCEPGPCGLKSLGPGAIDDDLVADFQRESVDAALRQLRHAAPFAAPTVTLPSLSVTSMLMKRMRIADIKFGDGGLPIFTVSPST
jgi:hypothetical protein